jgi:hypothetical protein
VCFQDWASFTHLHPVTAAWPGPTLEQHANHLPVADANHLPVAAALPALQGSLEEAHSHCLVALQALQKRSMADMPATRSDPSWRPSPDAGCSWASRDWSKQLAALRSTHLVGAAEASCARPPLPPAGGTWPPGTDEGAVGVGAPWGSRSLTQPSITCEVGGWGAEAPVPPPSHVIDGWINDLDPAGGANPNETS